MPTVNQYINAIKTQLARTRRYIEFDIEFDDIEFEVDKARIADNRVRNQLTEENSDEQPPTIRFNIRPYRRTTR